MKKKAIVAAALLCAVGFGAFAEVGTYFKGAVGYGYRWGMDWTVTQNGRTYSFKEDLYKDFDFDIYSHLVEIVPTFGIEPWRGSRNAFLRGLSFEISVDVGIGKSAMSMSYMGASETGDLDMSFVIAPKLMAVYTLRVGRVAPYLGVGASVPIVIIPKMSENNSDDRSASALNIEGVNGNVMAGVGFMVTESIMPVIEADFGFGTSMRIDARAGIVYRFGM